MIQYLNPAAFVQPDSTGWVLRPRLCGAGKWQFDMALSWIFGSTRPRRFELRAEVYNVTSNFLPGNPNMAFKVQHVRSELLAIRGSCSSP
jgi:hypothetical protein